jgi:phosphonate transport system substrate-binding protein
MAENADFICRAITQYIAARLGITAEFINDIPWQERERLLDAGRIQVCWICGLPYVWKAADPLAQIELLAAPVMSGERYRERPIYFSDVVVHQGSSFRTFADLRGASWV